MYVAAQGHLFPQRLRKKTTITPCHKVWHSQVLFRRSQLTGGRAGTQIQAASLRAPPPRGSSHQMPVGESGGARFMRKTSTSSQQARCCPSAKQDTAWRVGGAGSAARLNLPYLTSSLPQMPLPQGSNAPVPTPPQTAALF